jgi:diguanylate cyclase (GGDEF)-like protein
MHGQITHYVAIKEDITARKNAERELEHLAFTDPLTGLANRRHFFHHAETFFFSSHPSTQLAALMVDIDHFKNVNDQHGHAVGDEVLQEVAARLNRCLRPNDLIGRYGGEEFSIILPRADCETACQIADRLRLAVTNAPIRTAAGDIPLTISIGISCLTTEMQSLDKLLQSADDALYQAKHGGRNRCVVYKV